MTTEKTMRAPAITSVITFFVTFAVTIFLSSSLLFAQVESVETSVFQGAVIKMESRTFFLRSGDETRQVTLPDNVRITRDGQPIEISQVGLDDEVTVTMDPSGAVLSFDVMSSGAKRAMPLAIITAAGFVVVMIIILMFWKKTRKE